MHPELRRIQLIAPTSTDERIRVAAANTDGWLYVVTAHRHDRRARGGLRRGSRALVERTRALAPAGLPLYAGFGVSTPEHARAYAEVADGVVVGSRAVQIAEDGPDALREYVASLRAALDSV